MILRRRGTTKRLLGSIGLAVLLSLSMMPGANAYADGENISAADVSSHSTPLRVILYADLGSQFKLLSPTVTFVSDSGYQIGAAGNGGFTPWLNVSNNQAVKFSANNFRVKLGEAANVQEVTSIVTRLTSLKEVPTVLSVTRNGGTIYQVYVGDYTSQAEADKALTKFQGDATLSQGKPAVVSNSYLSAGSFTAQDQATGLLQRLLDAGVDATLAMQYSNGGLQFNVWVVAEDHDAAQQAAGVTLVPVDTAALALIAADDVTTVYTNQGTAIPHYYIAGNGAEKALVKPLGEGIKLAEKNRSYRGSFELSAYNSRLAVVNELPLEQYLYSVASVEVSPSWPQEAIKAQAVAARTYALYQGTKFKIGDVVDSTLSQAYYGMDREDPRTNAAVDATSGIIMQYQGKPIEPVYSSNSGGKTADASEIWNNALPYLVSVDSPDTAAEAGLPYWYQVMLADGTAGYVREDTVQDTGTKTKAGLPIFNITSNNTNIRPIPLVQNDVKAVKVVASGTQAVVLEKVIQSNTMHWVRGVYTSDELIKTINSKLSTPVSGPITSLEVSLRGPSGRVTSISVNGQEAKVKTGDTYRSMLNGLPSTLFDIEETGRYTILGANGTTRSVAGGNGTIQAYTSSGSQTLSQSYNLIMNGEFKARVSSNAVGFRFIGTGNGHGVGMSQWGAKGLADQGYDYQAILKHYYNGIEFVKSGQ